MKTKKLEVIKENKASFLILPPFINSHVHLGETAFRRIVPISNLKRYIATTEKKNILLQKGDYETICAYTLLSLIKSGVGHISCGRSWEEVDRAGIIGNLGYPLMKSNKLSRYYDDFSVGTFFALKDKVETERVKLDIWIHSLDRIDDSKLKIIEKILDMDENICISIHLSETKEQVRNCKAIYGKSEVETLESYGLLTRKANLVHCIHLSDNDIDLIKSKGASVTICPSSNLNMHKKIADVNKLIANKINICVGTDGFATGESKNLLDELNILSKHLKNKPSPRDLMDMISTNPSRLFSVIEQNFRKSHSDTIFFKYDDKFGDSEEKIIQNLIRYSPNPCRMIIGNKTILNDDKVLTIDEKDITKKFKKITERLKNE